MSLDTYRDFLNATGVFSDNPTQHMKDDLQTVANEGFEISSNYYVIKHIKRINSLDDFTTPVKTDIGVRLVTPYDIKQKTLIKDDFFKVIFKDFNYAVNLGDVFEFNNYKWIVISTSNIKSITNSVLIQRCNVTLKFTEQSPLTTNILTIPAVANKYIIDDLKNEQFILLPDTELDIIIPNDFLGRKIKWTDKGGTRFLLGSPYQNWKTTSYDNITMN
ncbi:hypothetical protein KY334_05465, partial [Candidatus Woesearchaeota archaeon]|nr:hypothetical protein [Candidatus Woesearchaeota archaeon]